MRHKFPLFLGFAAFLFFSCNRKESSTEDLSWLKNGIETARYQLKMTAEAIDRKNIQDTAVFPRSILNPVAMAHRAPGNWIDSIRLEKPKDWTSGFFPGSMWLTYEMTGDDTLKTEARKYTDLLAELQYYRGTHDLGFMINCSYGNAFRLAPESGDSMVIINAARSLISRFNPKKGVIRSWDFGTWTYPVIIDNMMNLELLFSAGKMTKDSIFFTISERHADNTMMHHYRPDMSCCHVVDYIDPAKNVIRQETYQGYSDSSVWARGQAWGLYGFTDCYKETKNKKYLDQARAIAEFIMNNPAIPEDLVPYWDYNAPDIPYAPRDASAAAVTASALFELSTLVNNGKTYFDYAEEIIKNLSSPDYLATRGSNNGFILKHSTGSYPHGSEIDVPLNYADYYYLEALKRYMEIKKIDSRNLFSKK